MFSKPVMSPILKNLNLVNKSVTKAETSHVDFFFADYPGSRWVVLMLIKREINRESSKTEKTAAFQGYRKGTFSLQACM